MALRSRRLFTHDSYAKNNESVTWVQREFKRHFNLNLNRAISSRISILGWVNALCTRGAGGRGAQWTVQAPENVGRIRQALIWSPNRSALRHSMNLASANRSVKRNLHEDLHPTHIQYNDHWATVETMEQYSLTSQVRWKQIFYLKKLYFVNKRWSSFFIPNCCYGLFEIWELQESLLHSQKVFCCEICHHIPFFWKTRMKTLLLGTPNVEWEW